MKNSNFWGGSRPVPALRNTTSTIPTLLSLSKKAFKRERERENICKERKTGTEATLLSLYSTTNMHISLSLPTRTVKSRVTDYYYLNK